MDNCGGHSSLSLAVHRINGMATWRGGGFWGTLDLFWIGKLQKWPWVSVKLFYLNYSIFTRLSSLIKYNMNGRFCRQLII